MAKMTNKDAKIRLYDGAATPYYLELDLDAGDFSGPIGTPLVEERLVLDRGNANANMHYIEGSDDAIMAPVNVSFTCVITNATHTTNLLNWLKAMNNNAATQVNSHTLSTTAADSQRNGANNNPVPADANKELCNIEYKPGTGLTFIYKEVFLPISQVQLTEAEDGINLAVTGMCYGTITTGTDFTAGTDVEA